MYVLCSILWETLGARGKRLPYVKAKNKCRYSTHRMQACCNITYVTCADAILSIHCPTRGKATWAHPGLLAKPLDCRDSGDLPSDMFTLASISDIFVGSLLSLSFLLYLSLYLLRRSPRFPCAKISHVFIAQHTIIRPTDSSCSLYDFEPHPRTIDNATNMRN